MHRLTRRLRGTFVALAMVALSAGAVLAAQPATVESPAAAAADGLARAAEAAGKTVPVRAAPALPVVADDEAREQDEDVPEVEETTEAAEPAAQGERQQNHGWFVSQAAQGATPATFGNHGEYVSEIAHGDQGKPAAATAAREAKAAKAPKVAKAPKAGDQ